MQTKTCFLYLSITIMFFSQATFARALSPVFQEEEPIFPPLSNEREVVEEKIDKETFELSPFLGIYALEGFNSSAVYGIRAGIHMTEDIFFEGNFALTSAEQTDFTLATGLSLLSSEEVVYWNVNLGVNLFPGQTFVSRKRTLNTTIYLVGGLGQTEFDDHDRFTFHFGTGYKIFFTDWLDMGFRLALHSFESDLSGENTRLYNIESTIHVAVFF
jgi:outer membrane beta-barrel protein